MSERFAALPPEAWTELGRAGYDDAWARFEGRFGFRAGVTADAWPAIREPVPSLTFDLSVISDGAPRGAVADHTEVEGERRYWFADSRPRIRSDSCSEAEPSLEPRPRIVVSGPAELGPGFRRQGCEPFTHVQNLAGTHRPSSRSEPSIRSMT